MVKFVAMQSNGRKILGVGLSQQNVEKLKEGLPILFSGEPLSLDGMDVLILFGKTEDDIQAELEEKCQCPPVSQLH